MKLTDQANYIPANTRTIETPDGATIHFVQGPVEHHPIPEITLRGNITGMATHPEWRRMSKAEKITFVKGALGDRHALKVRNGVTLYFLTPDFVQEALKLNTDAERLAFINANVIVVDPGEPLDLEIR